MAYQPVKVGMLHGWYIGDEAYAWLHDLQRAGVGGEFAGWVKGKVGSLFSNRTAVLKEDSGVYAYTVLIGQLVKESEVRTSIDKRFPIGLRVVLLTTSPEVGLTGKVITQQSRGIVGGVGFVPVMLDKGYVAWWLPENLGRLGRVTESIDWPSPPKNNDGRSTCFWCKAPTRTMELAFSTGNVCTQCGR